MPTHVDRADTHDSDFATLKHLYFNTGQLGQEILSCRPWMMLPSALRKTWTKQQGDQLLNKGGYFGIWGSRSHLHISSILRVILCLMRVLEGNIVLLRVAFSLRGLASGFVIS